jgi:hypothetical protein
MAYGLAPLPFLLLQVEIGKVRWPLSPERRYRTGGRDLHFWRAVQPTCGSVRLCSHMKRSISAIGIGEAPIGLQGTFSHWRSQEALRAFAYQE